MAYLPGWEMPQLKPEILTAHVGFILDYISELFHRQLRHAGNYGTLWERWFDRAEGQWTTRDKRSIDRTFSGFAKLIFPSGQMQKEDARLLLEMAIELRLRVRLQLHAIDPREFPLTSFSYVDRETGESRKLEIEV
jgi:ATP-dependent Lon protease